MCNKGKQIFKHFINMQFKKGKFKKTITGLLEKETVRTLGIKMKISYATVSRLSQGKPPDIYTFVKVCRYINKSANNFIK